MKITLNGFGIVGGIIGIGMTIYGIILTKRVNNAAKKIDQTVETLAENQPVDISQSVIDAAVEKAVGREAETKVKVATDMAVLDVQRDIRKQIQEAVDAEFDKAKESIGKQVVQTASDIDMDSFKKDIERKAEKAVLEKFYKMGGIPKIYGTFANAIDVPMNKIGGSIKEILELFPDYQREGVLDNLLKKTDRVPW